MIRPRRPLLALLGAVIATGLAAAPASADDPPSGHFNGGGSGSTATIGGSQSTGGSSGSSGTPSSPGSSSSGTPSTSPTPSISDLIPGATTGGPGTGSCDPANYPGGYSEDFAVPSPCIQPTEAEPEPGEPATPAVTAEMVAEAAQVNAPTAPPHVEPGAQSYVNIPNNYWTEAPAVQTSVTILGQVIPLTWTPTTTTWDFGDGTTATGEGVEGASLGQAGAIEHAYARQGDYDISTTTSYDLTFVLPGQGAQTIPLVSTPSAPVTLPVSEIQTRVNYVR